MKLKAEEARIKYYIDKIENIIASEIADTYPTGADKVAIKIYNIMKEVINV